MSRVLVRNAGDPEQVRAAETREVIERRQAREDLRAVMATPAGRRVIWRILNRGQAYVSAYRTDARDTARALGWSEHAVMLREDLIAHCLDLYVQMRVENDPEYEPDTTGDTP